MLFTSHLKLRANLAALAFAFALARPLTIRAAARLTVAGDFGLSLQASTVVPELVASLLDEAGATARCVTRANLDQSLYSQSQGSKSIFYFTFVNTANAKKKTCFARNFLQRSFVAVVWTAHDVARLILLAHAAARAAVWKPSEERRARNTRTHKRTCKRQSSSTRRRRTDPSSLARRKTRTCRSNSNIRRHQTSLSALGGSSLSYCRCLVFVVVCHGALTLYFVSLTCIRLRICRNRPIACTDTRTPAPCTPSSFRAAIAADCCVPCRVVRHTKSNPQKPDTRAHAHARTRTRTNTHARTHHVSPNAKRVYSCMPV